MEFVNARNEEIMRIYHEIVSSVPFIIRSDVMELIAESPASRFWVSEERAGFVVKAMLAGRPLPRMRETKKEMFDEIFRRFLIEREKQPHASVPELISIVIHQPAPKFYLTPRTIGEFIHRIKKGWYLKQHDRYRKIISPGDQL